MDSLEDLLTKLKECRVLVIGAGGIGCELLKNLTLTGFRKISVIDLDTIDISNLNRQFLFRKEHVGKPKALIASNAVKQIAQDAEVECFHDSVMSEKFGVNFFKQFSIIMSALDNIAARSHVNRLSLVANVPLIESGSAGYLGQVGVILNGKSECYDCKPKGGQKSYPSCTIRNTPSELIHCVVWSKSLYNQLFGEEDPDDDVAPDMSVDENMIQKSTMNGEKSPTENGTDQEKRISTRQFAEIHEYDCEKLFDKLFNSDIHYLISMEHLWKDRKRPTHLLFKEIVSTGLGGSRKAGINDKRSISQWTEVFADSLLELFVRFKDAKKKNVVLSWDKDDDTSMSFVASCANIRAHIFHIPGESLFSIKAMAGNIIPAIATTNACVAGMIVVEALKIIRGEIDKCRQVFINRQPNPRGKILCEERLCPPNPKCYVCSSERQVVLSVNLNKMEIGQLRDKVLIGSLNMIQPDVMDLFSNRIIISSDPGDTDSIENNKLSSLGIKNGSQLNCDDFAQQLDFKLLIFHSDELDAGEFELDSKETEQKPKEESTISDNELKSKIKECDEQMIDDRLDGIQNGNVAPDVFDTVFQNGSDDQSSCIPSKRSRLE